MAKDKQRPLPGFEVDRPTLHLPPSKKSTPFEDAATCAFCGGPGGFLCDFVLGVTDGTRNALLHTCDAPMCRRCKKQIMSMFVCSRGRRGHGCHHDTLDHCPNHAGQVEARPKKVLTAEEAESIRLDIWKKNL